VYDLLPQALVVRWVDEGADFEFPDNLAQLYLARIEANRKASIEHMCQEALQRIHAMHDQTLATPILQHGKEPL